MNVYVTATNKNYVLAGAGLTGSTTLNKSGAGTLVLSNANTYSGSTTISGGTLQVDNGGTTGTLGSGSVVDNAALVLDRSDITTTPNLISGSGVLVQSGVGTNVLTGTNTYSGGTLVNAGTLQIGDGVSTGTIGTGPVTNNAALVFDEAAALGLNAIISGRGSLTQNGSSSISLNASNSYDGATAINSGIVYAQNNTALGSTVGGTTIANGAELYIVGNTPNIGPEALTVGGTGVAGAGALRKGGASTTSFGGALTLTTNTLISIDSGAALNFTNAAGISGNTFNLTFTGAGSSTVAGNISLGTGGLLKAGTGALYLTATNNYSGGTILTNGDLQAASGAFGTGLVSVTPNPSWARLHAADGAVITNDIYLDGTNANAAGFLSGDATNANSISTFSGNITIASPTQISGGQLSGPTGNGILNFTGPVNFTGGAPFLIVRFGNVRFSGGGSYPQIQPRANTTSIGTNNGICPTASMEIGGNGSTNAATAFDLNGYNQTLGGLVGGVVTASTNNIAWVTNSAPAPSTLTLNLAAPFTYGGSIVGNVGITLAGGSQTFTKIGTSAPNGIYNYSGPTVVNAGTLALKNISLTGTPQITVAGGADLDVSAGGLNIGASQTLTGAGTVTGNAVVSGKLAAETNNIPADLTITGNLTLSGQTLVALNKTLALSNSLVSVSGILTNTGSGSIAVTNFGPALAVGDSFQLFNQAVANGAAMTISPAPGVGLAWTNRLAVDGSIAVIAGVATNPTNIVFTVSGSNLILNWPADHTGWTLQAQTNSLATGLGTNWVDVPGSTLVNAVTNNVDAGNGSVFYRLKY